MNIEVSDSAKAATMYHTVFETKKKKKKGTNGKGLQQKWRNYTSGVYYCMNYTAWVNCNSVNDTGDSLNTNINVLYKAVK